MKGMNIILGISGGIAAYKTPELVRRLKERGAEVQVVMTRSANEFVTETALQAVSGRPVRQNLWDKDAEAAMGHIELARWADLVLIAPATAEIMSRLAAGSAGDLLTTLCLATEAPLAIAPAMNQVMWSKPAVQENLRMLESRGARVLGPDSGDQACGETGYGRMLQPEEIADAVVERGRMLQPDDVVAPVMAPIAVPDAPESLLTGRKIMITAGPTREAIDPVRFISNRSSGKMGYALAEAARNAGAQVLLVSGPVALDAPHGVQLLSVESAHDMFDATHEHIAGVDIFIAAAAVADYHPADPQPGKIKKSERELSIDLERSPDILSSVAALENAPFTVGFAAETENLREYAKRKLEKKRLHMIIANLVGTQKGFEVDENAVDVYWRGGEQSFPVAAKTILAEDLIRLIGKRYLYTVGKQDMPDIAAIAIRD